MGAFNGTNQRFIVWGGGTTPNMYGHIYERERERERERGLLRLGGE